MRNEQAGSSHDLAEQRLRPYGSPRERTRTIVIRQGNLWQPLAFLCLCLLLLAAVLLGHQALRGIETRRQQDDAAMAQVQRRIQQLDASIAFDSKRRQLLLGMRDHILRVNPRLSLADAFRYAELAVDASERYPAVDPLLLLSIGVVESRYDPTARSHADARGLYQIWPSTGRLLLRALGWEYDEASLYDPQKNTFAAALYLDILFATYNDPQLVLAEYNGGPLNAGFFRAQAGALAAETRMYVPRVLALHERLTAEFASGLEARLEDMHRDGSRRGKTLAGDRPPLPPEAAPAPATAGRAKPMSGAVKLPAAPAGAERTAAGQR